MMEDIKLTIKQLEESMKTERAKIEYDQQMNTIRCMYIDEFVRNSLDVEALLNNPLIFYDILLYQNDTVLDEEIIDTLIFVRYSRSDEVKADYDRILEKIADNVEFEPLEDIKQIHLQAGDCT